MKDLFKDIKKRLLAHESDMDLDKAWASLESHRDKAKKKSRLRLISVLLLLLWIGGCGKWIWVGNFEKYAAQTERQQKSPAVPQIPPVGQSAPNSPNSITEHQYQGSNVENLTRGIPYPPTHDFSYAKPRSLALLPNTASAPLNGSDGSITPVPNTDKTPIQDTPINLQTVPEFQVPDNGAISASTQTTETPRNLPLSFLMIAQSDLSKLAPKSSDLNLPARINTPAQKPAKQKTTHATAVYVGGGWLTTQQAFQDNESQSAQGAASLRKQTEHPLPSFTFQVGVQHWIAKGRSLDFGVNYDQWYDRLDYTFKKPHTYEYQNVLLSIRQIENTGAELRQHGNTTLVGTQKVQALYYNRYSSLNLRLALVQSIYHKRHWDIAAGAGINASLWAQADGLVSAPDPAQGTYELDKIYKNAFGVGIHALTRLTYKFNDHYALQITPSATWGLSNALNTTSPLQSRLRQYSVTAGLVYKF